MVRLQQELDSRKQGLACELQSYIWVLTTNLYSLYMYRVSQKKVGSQKFSNCSNSLNFEAKINCNTIKTNVPKWRKTCTGLKFDWLNFYGPHSHILLLDHFEGPCIISLGWDAWLCWLQPHQELSLFNWPETSPAPQSCPSRPGTNLTLPAVISLRKPRL